MNFRINRDCWLMTILAMTVLFSTALIVSPETTAKHSQNIICGVEVGPKTKHLQYEVEKQYGHPLACTVDSKPASEKGHAFFQNDTPAIALAPDGRNALTVTHELLHLELGVPRNPYRFTPPAQISQARYADCMSWAFANVQHREIFNLLPSYGFKDGDSDYAMGVNHNENLLFEWPERDAFSLMRVHDSGYHNAEEKIKAILRSSGLGTQIELANWLIEKADAEKPTTIESEMNILRLHATRFLDLLSTTQPISSPLEDLGHYRKTVGRGVHTHGRMSPTARNFSRRRACSASR